MELCSVIRDEDLQRLDFGRYARELEGMRLDDMRIATRNSTVFRGIVPSGMRIAIKCVESRERAELEYRALLELFEATQGVVRFARPICLIAEHGLVVLEWVPGRSVYEYLRDRRVSVDEAHRVLAASGVWLRKFHKFSQEGQAALDLRKKLKQVDDLYEAVQRHGFRQRFLGWMRRDLRSNFQEFEGRTLTQARLHGDFKPENLLIDGGCATAIDVGHIYRSCVWNDVAYFLVHIEWGVLRRLNLKLLVRIPRLRQAFLTSYQTEVEVGVSNVLAWLEREVLYRLAYHHLSGAQIRPGDLVALVVIGWMFISRGTAARKLNWGSSGAPGNAP